MSYPKFPIPLFITALILFSSPLVFAQSDIRSEQVQFEQNASSAVIEDTITGYETVDYVLNAQAGQSMNVSMATDNTANYFNILEPGETEVAIFNGSINENQYEGVLRESGNYTIRVYMMRSAARRNEVANYRLEMTIGDNSSGVSANQNDALVSGTNYNATGDIPCSIDVGQPTGSCPFGVTREGNGNGTVTVTMPDGRTRVIFFENGHAIGYDRSEADPGEFSAEKQGDLNIIRIGQERYEIPDAVIFGD
ncbi:hypothetical protein C7B61_04220 [filamentous cyanobacterium CCP1]|nr:hypothetical protein C7B76_07555 [filamentous cyanobacterium CCP2]PSB67807.1 hypothetical protein C7B61_04220 [filamentous cyanobacterium CCP1]